MTNEELTNFTEEDLVGILSSRYGFEADAKIPKQMLIDKILKCQADNILSAAETTKIACKEWNILLAYEQHYDKLKNKKVTRSMLRELPLLAPEPMMQVKFDHKDGDHELKFRFKGNMKIPLKGKGTRRRWAWMPPLWHLISGLTYVIPFTVYQHLNSRIVTDAKLVTDEKGNQRSQPYMRQRMNASIIMTREDAEKLTKKEVAHATKSN